MSEVYYIVEHLLTGGLLVLTAWYMPRLIGKKFSKMTVEIVQGGLLAYGIAYGFVFTIIYLIANVLSVHVIALFR